MSDTEALSAEPTDPTAPLLPAAADSARTTAATPAATATPAAIATPDTPVMNAALGTSAAPAPTAPRIRWAAIVWGLLFAGIASALLWVVTDVGNRDAASLWLKTVSPATLVLVILLVVGGLLLVAGLASLLRRITSGRS
ncbi:hypothetical protein E6C70_15915 [Glaciibacter flavus]|uniref:Uncharacterized protein n=1 Tax=Orlajensenia flava TaxID=2565934 RepID=A0A4S4FFV5_9MICO|nr:hypothetical protein [Glaciibacter flavus]THG29100.1 hypothetical protein E6C70_15915 [Glaciibacter flavus]